MDTLEQGSHAAQGTEAPAAPVDNISSGVDAPGAGEFSDAMMERPAYVPEKFFKDGRINIKALAESYGELEKSRSTQPKTESTPAPGSTSTEGTKPGEAPKTDGQTQNPPQIVIPGVNQASMEHYSKEIQKDGKLSDASYGDLAKLGYPKTVVDAYVKGLMADAMVNNAVSETKLAMQEVSNITASIGGEKVLGEMLQWASSNLSPQELAVYNEAVSGSDAAKVKMAVHGMYHAFKEAKGPSLIGGRPPVNAGSNVVPFKSVDEVVLAMQNPRYDKDPSYRQEIEARIAVSNVFGQSREYKTQQ